MKPEKRARLGGGGSCVCVECGHREPHRAGVPRRDERCPKCGKGMLRESSPHHRAALERQREKAK
jgi:ribosomal protein L40E